MKVLHYAVDAPGRLVEVDGSLKSLQKLVGGYIEPLPRRLGAHGTLVVLVNEEGQLNRLPFNRRVAGYPVVGDFFVTRADGEEFASLIEADVKEARAAIEGQ